MKNKNLLVLVAVWTLLFGVTSATSSYIHEVNGTISICDPNDSTKCITMKNKNEWVTQAWVGCIKYQNYCEPMWQAVGASDLESCINDGYGTVYCNLSWESFWDLFSSQADCEENWEDLFNSCLENHGWEYGNHYQRWNNYWFSSNPEASISTGDQQIDCSIYNPLESFSSSTFIISPNWSFYDYCISRNDNLWWWADDSQENNWWYDEEHNVAFNVTWRQWPCDTWYHVPSIWERNQVLKYWAQENGIELEDDGGLKYNWDTLDWLKFQEDFKIPFAGYRDYYHNVKVNEIGAYAGLWSSSPIVGNANARFFNLNPYVASAIYPQPRAYGLSLRCFQNSYLSFPTNENGDSGSGSASTHVTLTLTAWSNTCTLNDYNLGTHNASAEEQYVESSWQEILCEFLQNTWVRVLLSMGDLTDWSKLIWAENFTWVVTAIGNSLWSISNLTWWNYNLSWSQEIYRKAENTLWKWTWDLQIIWTIPAWTPSGTYTWSLEIVIQEG